MQQIIGGDIILGGKLQGLLHRLFGIRGRLLIVSFWLLPGDRCRCISVSRARVLFLRKLTSGTSNQQNEKS